MAKMRECMECGKAFNDDAGTGLCMVCEMLVQAVEKPERLKVMEAVREGRGPDTEEGRGLAAWLAKDRKGYYAEVRALEREWGSRCREWAAANRQEKPEAAPAEEPLEDAGTERAEELVERWLAEHGAR